MKRLFNENSFLGKVESFIRKLYAKEAIRFLFWGAINTLFTYLLTQLVNYAIFVPNKLNPTPIFADSSEAILIEIGNKFSIPYIIAFVISIPVSYTTNALFAFKQEWKWVRLCRYPLSSIPNFIVNLFGIWLFNIVLSWPYFIATFIAAIIPLPVMFFINKFLVGPIKLNKKNKESENSESGV